MTRGLRWRVFTLQVGLIGIFGMVTGFAFWGSNFATGQVRDQLTAQQVFFPAAGSASITALPAADAAALAPYAGQQVTTGVQAAAYADHFIGVHLLAIAGGKTYSQVSALAQASPTDTKLAAQVQTLFRGETLRGLLLNSYGWWQIGTYAFYAAIGLAIATLAVLVALAVELVIWRREALRGATSVARRHSAEAHAAA
jgi:heme exporter protein D